jgi:hypothetical protein
MRRRDNAWVTLGCIVLCACAKSIEPSPNENTNWLGMCDADADCGQAAACLCGVCSMPCDTHAWCERTSGAPSRCVSEASPKLDAQCGEPSPSASICVASCTSDGDCAAYGRGSHCERGVCLSAANAFDEGTPGSISVADGGRTTFDGDAGATQRPRGCDPVEDGCATFIARGLAGPNTIAIDAERVYWLNTGSGTLADGSLMSTPMPAMTASSMPPRW